MLNTILLIMSMFCTVSKMIQNNFTQIFWNLIKYNTKTGFHWIFTHAEICGSKVFICVCLCVLSAWQNQNGWSSSRVGFNVPPNTLSGTIFTGQMTQPTVSSTEGQQLVSPPVKGPISPDQALYKVKWSKYNFEKKKHLYSTIKSEIQRCLEDWEIDPMRSKPNPVDQPERTAHYDGAMCIAEMLHNTRL